MKPTIDETIKELEGRAFAMRAAKIMLPDLVPGALLSSAMLREDQCDRHRFEITDFGDDEPIVSLFLGKSFISNGVEIIVWRSESTDLHLVMNRFFTSLKGVT